MNAEKSWKTLLDKPAVAHVTRKTDFFNGLLSLLFFDGDGFDLSGAGLDAAYITDCWVSAPEHYSTTDGVGVNGTGINIDPTVEDATVTVDEFHAYRREIGILHNGIDVNLTVTNSGFSSWGFDTTGVGFSARADEVFGIKIDNATNFSSSGTGNVVIGGSQGMGNTFTNLAGTGIYLDGNNGDGLQVTISNNTIGSNTASGDSIGRNGILAERWQGTIDGDTYHSSITKNTIRDCIRSGIELRESRNIRIGDNNNDINNGNNIYGNGYTGIKITDSYDAGAPTQYYSQNILLEENEIYNNSYCGIFIQSGSGDSKVTGITIQENIVSYNGFRGIEIDGSSGGEISAVSIRREDILTPTLFNIIQANASSGVVIDGDNVHDIDVIGQTFIGNGGAPIRTDDADVYGGCFFYNEYSISTDPINLTNGSNHGLVAPVVENLGIYKNTNWYVPYSLYAGEAFSEKQFVIQAYLKEESATPGEYEYTFLTCAEIQADLAGNIEGSITIPGSYDYQYIALVATCDDIVENGECAGDTSEFSSVAQLVGTAPRVVKVEVGNASHPYYEIVTAANNYTQLMPVKLDGGVDRVTITFDRPIDNTAAVQNALSINGWGAPTSVSFIDDRTVTWFFANTYMAGEKTLTLTASSITTNGVALDGEWNSPTYWGDTEDISTFANGGHSGNESEGGDFTFNFTLPNTQIGDANRDGIVNNLDAAILASFWLRSGMSWTNGDFDGNGIVNDIDATLLAINWLNTVWAA